MSLTYTTWKTAIANLTVVGETALADMYPLAIDYAEGRCYRDLDLLDTEVRDATTTTTANTRTFTLPTPSGTGSYYTIIDGINIVQSNSRTPVTQTTQEYIDFIYPSNVAPSASSVPAYYAMVDQDSLIWGPAPGASYTVEVAGRTRPVALSASNTTTILTDRYSELFVAASMVFAAGYLKNYGSQADDPKMAMSWEQLYLNLLKTATMDNDRSSGQGDTWTTNRASSAISNQRGAA